MTKLWRRNRRKNTSSKVKVNETSNQRVLFNQKFEILLGFLQIFDDFGWQNSANFALVVIQFLEKIRDKLKVSEKEKSSLSSENTIDFDNNNVTRKKNLLKNSWHVHHKGTNFGREYFSHICNLVMIAHNKERGPYKNYTDKDRYYIRSMQAETVQ